MFQRFALTLGKGFGLACLMGPLLAMPACSSNPGASTTGMGGHGGSTDAGAGGHKDASITGAGGYVPPPIVPCTPAIAKMPLLTDFSTGDTFGDGLTLPTGTAEVYGGLTTDTSAGNWHVMGTITGASGSAGFFIDFTNCPVDLSRYQGLELTMGGNVGPNGRILLQVFTGEDNFVTFPNMPPSSDDIVLHNSCQWTTNMYLECIEPSRTIVVPASATTTAPTKLSYTWNQFVGGRPQTSPNPALITRIQFLPITPPSSTTPSYDIDVVIDEISLLTSAPDAGADASTDAGVDAPADAITDVPVDTSVDAPVDAAATDADGGAADAGD